MNHPRAEVRTREPLQPLQPLQPLEPLEPLEPPVQEIWVRAHVTDGLGRADAPALVLMPGLGVSHRYLMPLARRMAEDYGYRCYALDLPGYGTWQKRGRPRMLAEQAEQVAAWMDRVGLGRAVLLGNSLGSEVIVHLAARFPEHVLCGVLTSPTMDAEGRTLLKAVWRLLRVAPREPLRLVPMVVYEWLATGPVWMTRGLAAILADPIEDLLPRVQAPMLVVRGEYDTMVPARWAKLVAALLPRGRFAQVAGATHAVPFDAPAALAELVHAFLAEVSRELVSVPRETV